MDLYTFLSREDSSVDPKKAKEADKNRLDTLTTAVAMQAIWKAGRTRLLFFIFGFLFLPPVGFWLATQTVQDEASIAFGLVGLAGYFATGVLVWLIGTRLVESDPEQALETLMPSLKAEEAKYRSRWGKA